MNENELTKLNDQLSRLTSFKFVFLRGIISGIGTAIGATIIAGILLGILSGLINRVDSIPIFEQLIEKTDLKAIVNQNM